jgi:hypothetical protein
MGPINEHLVCAEVEATAVTRCVRMLASAGVRRRRCGSVLRPERGRAADRLTWHGRDQKCGAPAG